MTLIPCCHGVQRREGDTFKETLEEPEDNKSPNIDLGNNRTEEGETASQDQTQTIHFLKPEALSQSATQDLR